MRNRTLMVKMSKTKRHIKLLIFFSFLMIVGAVKGQEITTFMKDGGWCWYQDPRAIINNGKLIIGGVSGESGDIKIGIYDLVENEQLGSVVLHKNFQADDHDAPAFYIRPDGSILAVYAKHGNEPIHYYSISSPDNYLEWSEPKKFIHDYNSKNKGVTYMNLYYMENEKLLYNFFRDGPNFNPAFITSADHGETWGGETHLLTDGLEGRNRPYARYLQRDSNTIGISFTEGHPRNYGNSLFYADFKNGSFFNVDGSKIKDLADGPLSPSETGKIYKGSGIRTDGKKDSSAVNSAWTAAIAKDKNDRPILGYTLYLNNKDHRYRMASWNGKDWIDREVAFAGECLYPIESSYTGLLAFDPSDSRNVFISTNADPSTGKDLGIYNEIYSAVINNHDSIESIKWKAITSDSNYQNIRPIAVSGEGYTVLLWLGDGPWKTYTDYKVNVIGLIINRPQKQ